LEPPIKGRVNLHYLANFIQAVAGDGDAAFDGRAKLDVFAAGFEWVEGAQAV
jgi:hypothetical protein